MADPVIIPGTDVAIREGRVFAIAEIGKNFIRTEERAAAEMLLANALELIELAADAGADAVKFQTHEVEDEQLPLDVVSPHFSGANRYSWVRRNTEDTPDGFWDAVRARAAARGVLFFSTPMSRLAAVKLERFSVPLWKIGSGDVQDFVMLDYIRESGKPVIISTGMVGKAELDETVDFLHARAVSTIILYCVSRYPCPPQDFNLSAIPYLRTHYLDCQVGFSDHSIGDEVARAAVALGATVVEKHFSTDRMLWGPDHKVSMLPEEFATMVRRIRAGELVDPAPYLGDSDADFEGATNTFRPIFNKSLMAATDIPAGTVITKELVYAMRPFAYAGGLPAKDYPSVLGRKTVVPLRKYDPIRVDTLGAPDA